MSELVIPDSLSSLAFTRDQDEALAAMQSRIETRNQRLDELVRLCARNAQLEADVDEAKGEMYVALREQLDSLELERVEDLAERMQLMLEKLEKKAGTGASG